MPAAILKVALDVPLNQLFDYLNNGSEVVIGTRVLVSFANRQHIGVVWALAEHSDIPSSKLKAIHTAFVDEPPVHSNIVQLIQFSADYYHYPIGQAVLSVLPVALRKTTAVPITPPHYFYRLSALGRISVLPQQQRAMNRVLAGLREHECLEESTLLSISTPRITRPILKRLLVKGLIERIECEGSSAVAISPSITIPKLNVEQQAAVDAVIAAEVLGGFNAWLLHGITGSGKSEVYMQVMAHILQTSDAQVLVLVPEINLTPQLEARFRARFPTISLVSLHSHLSDKSRLRHWQQAQAGHANIVLGTRLAVFTPMPRLALIVIDEEHDTSYKQQDGMRYHARDVALMRAKLLNIPIILGSATPALESWYNVPSKYQLLTLQQRAVTGANLPRIHCVDTRQHPVQDGLSGPLIKALQTCLARGEQSLLFINRRGFAPVLLCKACYWMAPCPRCSCRLVVHLQIKRLRCHHCGHQAAVPKQCPTCGNVDLSPIGIGTQRVEEHLTQVLPTARIARVDRDSMRRKDAVAQLLQKMESGEIDILVGTQMLTKGHDFANLTLVGVIDTDSALFSADFRASERLFAQLMQVAGRAGRSTKTGVVIIQTVFPQHPLFTALNQQDYASYAKVLLAERAEAGLPPFVFSALLRAEAPHYAQVVAFLTAAFNYAHVLHPQVTMYMATRPLLERLNNSERGQLFIESSQRGALQQVLKALSTHLYTLALPKKLRWAIDVEPLDF